MTHVARFFIKRDEKARKGCTLWQRRVLSLLLSGLCLAWAPALHAEPIARFESIDVGGTPPTSCVPFKSIFLDTTNKSMQVCDATGTAFESYGAAGSTTTGIRTSATELLTTRDSVTTVTGNITLDLNNIVFVTVGSGGAIATLPNAGNTAKPGKYKLRIADTGTGLLSVAPSAGNTINGSTTAWPGITGQFAGYDVERVSTTGWHLVAYAAAPIGEFAGLLCSGVNGSTNQSSINPATFVAHSLTCVIPANTFQTGTVVEACSSFHVTTGASAPNELYWRLRGNTTYLTANLDPIVLVSNIANRTATVCSTLVSSTPAGGNVTLYQGVIMPFTALGSDQESVTAPPQTFAQNAALTLEWSTYWSNAGTGTNNIQQRSMFVRTLR